MIIDNITIQLSLRMPQSAIDDMKRLQLKLKNRIEMNTKIIDQIRSIGGVKTVEPAGKDMAVVVFEAQKKKPIFVTEDGVECLENTDTCFWLDLKDNRIGRQPFVHEGMSIHKNFKYFSTKQAAEAYIAEHKIIKEAISRGFVDGAKYMSPNGAFMRTVKYPLHVNLLRGGFEIGDADTNFIFYENWGKVIISLKPEELVDGEIYVDEYKPNRMNIFRATGRSNSNTTATHSIFNNERDEYCGAGYLHFGDTLRPATLLEKQKLVRAEVANNFFYKL